MLDAFFIMKWPLLACLLLPGLLVYCGLHIVRREIIFVDLALAQVAALGACVAILLGHEPGQWQGYAWSLGFTLAGAAVFTLTRGGDHRVPQEALIGIVYVVAAAFGILLLSRNPEGNEELRRTLVGDILVVQPGQVLKTFALYAAIGAVHFACRKKFLQISYDPAGAARAGLSIRGWDFLFYALFGLVVTSFVQIGGVLLIFTYLIVPACCAHFLCDRFGARLAAGWVTAMLGGLIGLYASYALDLPTGAAIVCALGLLLVVAGAVSPLLRRSG
jgi:zinc/manganese transport system permease protein